MYGTRTDVKLKLAIPTKLLGHQIQGGGGTLSDIRSRRAQARQRFNKLTQM
jgi:hypothetical protein